MGLSNSIIEDIRKKIEEKKTNISFFRDQIILVDGEKEQYDAAINILDNDLLSKIEEVNNTLYDVRDAYQDRINVGCRTDLFWRSVGFSTGGLFSLFDLFTLRCTKLSLPAYQNIGTIPVGVGDTSYGSILSYFNGTQQIDYSLKNQLGWIDDNLHGIKYYTEPIAEDIGDTKIASFIGTIGTGTTELVVMTPFDNGLENIFKEGQLVISDKEGVFPEASNRIVGIATTTTDFVELTSGIETVEISGVFYFQDSSGKILGLANSIVEDQIAIFGGTTITFDASESYTISSGITGGSGSGALFSVQRNSSGDISSVEVVSGGSGYNVGEQLLVPGSLIGGGGNINTITGTGTTVGTAATYTGRTGTTSGSGVGAEFTIERNNIGSIVLLEVETAGIRYEVGDTITILGGQVGGVNGTDNIVITVTDVVDNDKIYISILEVSTPSVPLVVNTLILSDIATSNVTVPELDGSFVTFTVLDDPINISNVNEYAIPFQKNPFSPQTIGIMNSNNIGIGRSLIYDNSGNFSNTQSWKPENAVRGIPNVPDVIEPSVGAGKIYYKVGFNQRPINPNTGLPAVEGETISIFDLFFGTPFPLYEALPSCPIQEVNLTNAINARDTKEVEFANELGEFNILLQSSCALRDERNVFDSRIWGLRQSIGGEIDDINRYNVLETYIESSTVNSIID